MRTVVPCMLFVYNIWNGSRKINMLTSSYVCPALHNEWRTVMSSIAHVFAAWLVCCKNKWILSELDRWTNTIISFVLSFWHMSLCCTLWLFIDLFIFILGQPTTYCSSLHYRYFTYSCWSFGMQAVAYSSKKALVNTCKHICILSARFLLQLASGCGVHFNKVL